VTDLDGPGWSDAVWVNEPTRWRRQGADLSLTADGGTDFWRHTHYGFVRDSGHAALTRVPGEFVATVEVQADYRDQYDQAGLMVRLDPERWVKCGIEFVDGTHQLSTVVTHSVSDWSCTPVEELPEWLGIRLTRRGDALTVDFSTAPGRWQMSRLAYLPPDLPAWVGPMAAAPDGTGFDVRFRGFDLQPL
jgi:hypothetical protein